MALPWSLLLELALYASCFVCGIITAASVTITQGALNGKCVLYGSVEYNGSAQIINVGSYSPLSLCYFVSAISVCVAIFCFSLSLYWIYTICMEGEVQRERLWMNVTLCVCGVFLFFLLITGCILKIGLDKLCESLQQKVTNLTRCSDAETKKWASSYDGSEFYTRLQSAQTSVWVNFFCWIIIGILLIFQRRQGNSEFRSGGEDVGASPSETEPFFHRPGQTK
ncbi:transmembrane protein 179B-like [Denticeps clupeoides]|uniref:Transmembrane protein 179B n=1 Tax=Denticeps clupeoides TaxID=299321 RepID=A0AAY4BS13_9TELE|nr:transmembrane protein 179B-like [Denticeps clupeoides]